jgi:hypothetical protein
LPVTVPEIASFFSFIVVLRPFKISEDEKAPEKRLCLKRARQSHGPNEAGVNPLMQAIAA